MAKAQAQEPSMEEILASIRRIIADEEPKAKAPDPEPEPDMADDHMNEDDLDKLFASAGTDDEDEPLELADFAEPELVEPDEDISFAEPEPPPPPPPPPVVAKAPPPPPPPPAPAPQAILPEPTQERLLSEATDYAVQAAFGNLANTILSNSTRTLEDIVKDMMRPMLKAWLDENLPTVVERLVRAEIERVARGPIR